MKEDALLTDTAHVKDDATRDVEPEKAVAASRRVFTLLKKYGPLSSSQIAVELGLSLATIRAALQLLEKRGLVEHRPDRDKSKKYEGEEAAYGLV